MRESELPLLLRNAGAKGVDDERGGRFELEEGPRSEGETEAESCALGGDCELPPAPAPAPAPPSLPPPPPMSCLSISCKEAGYALGRVPC
eukprot:3100441-Pleurochrysis_carterae.AAC.4